MMQTGKDLLLKDICGRLPYRVKVQIKNEIVVLDSICDDDGYHFNFIGDNREGVNIENIKPYLFPLSSITEKQEEEFKNLFYRYHESAFIFNERFAYGKYSIKDIGFYPCYLQDWLLKNHFDIYGLIPMGLANDATGLNIY